MVDAQVGNHVLARPAFTHFSTPGRDFRGWPCQTMDVIAQLGINPDIVIVCTLVSMKTSAFMQFLTRYAR
jgi:hypothetical protein